MTLKVPSFPRRRESIIVIAFILLLNLSASAVQFKGGLRMRYDNGNEVDPQSLQDYPDNQTDRHYFEGLLTGELLYDKIPFGDRLRLGIRMLEFRPSAVDRQLYGFERELRIDDKIYAQLNKGGWEFRAGDVYETFGKGLVLNLFENRDLYFDSGLRGGKVSYLSKKYRFKAIYGTSREWYLVNKENVGGLNFEYRPVKGLQTGASLVRQEGLYYDEQYMPELYAGYEFYPVTIFADYAQKRTDDFDMMTGEGTFASMTAAIAGIAAQVNYKYYQFGEENVFQTPPTVQREFTTKLMAAHPHLPLMSDQVGFEIDLSASPTDVIFLNLNFSRASVHEGSNFLPSLKEDYEPFWELFLEGDYEASEKISTKTALGTNEEARPNYWEKKTGFFNETIVSLTDLWSVTTVLERMWVEDVENDENFADNYIALTFSRAPYGSLTFSFENSSQESSTEGDQWIGTELAITIKSQHRLTFFAGQERGGLKCTSGVCRPVQPFEGFRIGYEGRF